MRALSARVATHLTCRRGATTAEYALILALIVIALMGTLGELRNALAGKLQEVIQELRR
jgi:Flp pilus assembly pilin Flp